METVAVRRFPHVQKGAGEAYDVIGELLTFKVTSADTGGAFTVLELLARPGGGPPLHTHPSAETFTILEGAFEFSGLDDGDPYTVHAVPGDTVFIPGGAPHAYKAVGLAPGKAMVVLTPGVEMEQFFSEAGVRVTGERQSPSAPPDIPAMIAIAQKHGLQFMGPGGH